MARPKRNDVDYFPHSVIHGKKMTIIRNKYKNDGYTVWFMLLEELGKANFHYLNYGDEEIREYLESLFDVESEVLLGVIEHLVKWGEFDHELWSVSKILFNQHFCDKLARLYEKRANDCVTKNSLIDYLLTLKIVTSQQKNEIFALCGVSGVDNPQSKVKESKVKESNDHVEKFPLFWDAYPKRNGKKVGKQMSLKNFKKIPIDELDRVIRNARIYGVGNDYAKDPERFLKNDFWQDWDTPPAFPLPGKSTLKRPVNANEKKMNDLMNKVTN